MPLEVMQRIHVARLRFHNVRKLLHLPLMKRSYNGPKYDYSRLATLESARVMIDSYQALRDEHRPILHTCDLVDFQVFTAAVVLVVDLLGRSRSLRDNSQEKEDWQLIENVTATIGRLAQTTVCKVASRAAPVLEYFCRINKGNQDWSGQKAEVIVPYFGKVRIKHTKLSANRSDMERIFSPDHDRSGDRYGDVEATTGLLQSEDGDPFDVVPGPAQPGQDLGLEWNPMVDFGLREDWSWFTHIDEDQ